MPKGFALDAADFLDGSGSDTVRYELELPAYVVEQVEEGLSVSVEASLYYQAIPPFYVECWAR